MIKKIKIASIIIILILYFISQVKANEQLTFQLSKCTNDNNLYALDITIPNHHYIYWIYPGKLGLATTIDSTQLINLKIYWPKPIIKNINHQDKIFIYQDKTQILFSKDQDDRPFDLNINYLLCAQQCLLKQAIINYQPFNSSVISCSNKLIELDDKLVIELNSSTKISNQFDLVIKVTAKSNQLNDIKLIAKSPNNLSTTVKLVEIIDSKTAIFNLKWPISDNQLTLIAFNEQNAVQQSFNLGSNQQPTLLFILIVAFLAGALLNIMPCVLPVLSLKITSLIRHNNKSSKINLLANIFGILVSFLIIALITIFTSMTSKAIGLGLHFQQPIFIISLSILITFFISSLLSKDIYLNLPNWLNNFLSKNYSSKILVNNFINGVFTTLLATPCTAPFIGTTIGFALSAGPIYILLVFLSMGMGLALPYLITIIIPNFDKFIPKSGKWLEKLNLISAILLILTILWLAYILSNQIGRLAGILLLLCCLLLKFIIQSLPTFKIAYWQKLISISLLVILTYLLPIKTASNFKNYQHKINQTWQAFEPLDLTEILNSQQVVVIDVTADWCITCQLNKKLVLDRADMLNFFQNHNILTYRADITNSKPEIIKYLNSFRRYGVPFNIVYGPNAPQGIILSNLLSQHELMMAIKQASTVELIN